MPAEGGPFDSALIRVHFRGMHNEPCWTISACAESDRPLYNVTAEQAASTQQGVPGAGCLHLETVHACSEAGQHLRVIMWNKPWAKSLWLSAHRHHLTAEARRLVNWQECRDVLDRVHTAGVMGWGSWYGVRVEHATLAAVGTNTDAVRGGAVGYTGRGHAPGAMEVSPKPGVTLALMHTVADMVTDERMLLP
jgi:hypothetical protein